MKKLITIFAVFLCVAVNTNAQRDTSSYTVIQMDSAITAARAIYMGTASQTTLPIGTDIITGVSVSGGLKGMTLASLPISNAVNQALSSKVNLNISNGSSPSYQDFYRAFLDSIRAIWVQFESYIPPDTTSPPGPTVPVTPTNFVLNTTQGSTGNFVLTWFCADTTVVFESTNGGTTFNIAVTLAPFTNTWTRSGMPAGTTRHYYLQARDSSVYSQPTVVRSATIINPVSGGTWYVSNAAAGNGSGTSWANAALVTSFSWSQVQLGDVVYVDGGTDSLVYNNMRLIPTKSGTASQRITITKGVDAGHNGTPTFLFNTTSTTYILDIRGYNYITVNGINFIQGTGSSGSGFQATFIQNSDFITLSNCEFYHPLSKGLRLDASDNTIIEYCKYYGGAGNLPGADVDNIHLTNNGHSLTLRYSELWMLNSDAGSGSHKDNIQTYLWQTDDIGTSNIYNNFIAAPYPTSTSCSLVDGGATAGRWNIYNNIWFDNTNQSSSRRVMFSNCGGNDIGNVKYVMNFYNNTCYFPNTEGGGILFDGCDTLRFKNNIVYNYDGTYLVMMADPTVTVRDIDYNIYVETRGDAFGWVNCDAQSAQSFAQWKTYLGGGAQESHSFDSGSSTYLTWAGTLPSNNPQGYALQSGTNGVNDGVTIPLVTTDYNGNPRPLEGAYDIGAFEFNSGGTPVDSIPNSVSFTNVTNATTSQTYTSNTVTFSGFTSPCNVTISGGSATFQIGLTGTFDNTMKQITDGNQMRIRMDASGSAGTAVQCTVTVANSQVYYWTVTTTSGSAYSQATLDYVARVEADGGTIVDIDAIEIAYDGAAAGNMNLDSVLVWVSPKYGVKLSGGTVSKLYDLGNGDNDFIQNTVANQPIYYADSIKFDGVNDYMISTFGGTFVQPNTITMAYNDINGSAGSNGQWDGITAGARENMTGRYNEMSIYAGAGPLDFPSTTWDYSVPLQHIVTVVYNTADSTFDAGVYDGGGDAGAMSITGITLAAQYDLTAGVFCPLAVKEFFVYARTGIRTVIEGIIDTQWSILP